MNDETSDGEDFDRLADSFRARLRNGETPSLSEYTQCNPALAEKILELFPALVALEGPRPGADGLTDTVAGRQRPEPNAMSLNLLGDYRILREIGSGGLGVVYEAVRESLRTHVALKVLHPQCRDKATFRARFRNEARSAARLHHTNIVQVFDFGEHEGILYYVMQYIAGQGLDRVLRDVRRLRGVPPASPVAAAEASTLAQSLQTGRDHEESPTLSKSALAATLPMPSEPSSHIAQTANALERDSGETTLADHDEDRLSPSLLAQTELNAKSQPLGNDDDHSSSSLVSSLSGSNQPLYHREVARIGAEVAEALAYAHNRGVLHRDIKPSNLLLDARGTVWVTDFGLAKFDGSENMTEANDLVGTLRYMAPERFEGRSDVRCDIYALGVTLYEMLALRPAFDDSNQPQLIRHILNAPPTPLRKHDPRISLDLSTVVHKAMARDPSDRFASAAELAAELRRVVSNRPINSRRPPLLEQYWRWCKRNPLVASLNALAAILTITIAIISTTAAAWLNKSNTEVKRQLRLVKTSERERSEQLWEATVAQARASRFTRQSGQRFDTLAAIDRAAKLGRQLDHPPERFNRLRNEAIASMALPDIRLARRYGSLPSGFISTDVDERFERYALVDRLGNVTVRQVDDDLELYRLEGFNNGGEAWVNLSPDGRSLLVMGSTRRLKVWRLDGPKAVLLLDDSMRITSFFTSDNRYLAYISTGGELTLLDCGTGQKRVLPSIAATPVWIAIHAETLQIAVGVAIGDRHEVQIRTFDDPISSATLTVPAQVGFLAWNQDGRRLVAACADRKLYVWDLASPRAIVLEGHKSFGIIAAFNHRGDLLASNDWTSTLRLWDPRSGQQVFSTAGSNATLRFSLDDRCLNGSWDGQGWEVREVATGLEHRALAGDPTRESLHLTHIAFPPGHRMISSGTYKGVRFWDIATGEELPPTTSSSWTTVGFPADSREMLTYGPAGLFRWPVQTDDLGGTMRIGPPESLLTIGSITQMAHSQDGRVVGLSGIATGALLLHRGSQSRTVPLGPQADVRLIAVSPDGRWAATGSFIGFDAGVFVWDAATGRRVAVLPVLDKGRLSFSPDSRWLTTDVGNSTQLWAVDTWKPGLKFEGRSARFSPDGTQLALAKGTTVRLVDSTTGRELAAFEDPVLRRPTSLFFNIDGTYLAAINDDLDPISVWNLRPIRTQLATLGLDWDRPPYPPETKPSIAIKLKVVGAELLDPNSSFSQWWNLLAPWRKGIKADAQDYLLRADALVRQGWHDLALKDYQTAVRRNPRLTDARMRRGLELFRRNLWQAAAEDFNAVLEGDPNDPSRGSARSRLAWAYHELGRNDEAADQLVKLLDTSPASWSPEDRAGLLLLQSEFHNQAGKPDQAKAARDQATSASPHLAKAANARAWLWLMPPSNQPAAQNWRFVPASLFLARKAVELAPDEPLYANTLGVALYRSGQYAQARAVLEASLLRSKGEQDAWDLFPLAMCHHRLGDRKAARDSYDKAVAWVKSRGDATPGDARELAEFQSESRSLLGIRD